VVPLTAYPRYAFISLASSFHKFGRLRWAKKFGGKDTAALLKQWSPGGHMPRKLVPVKQTVVVGSKKFEIVNGQVLTSKEAKEERVSQ